jgi:hypothetical protein
MGPSVPDINWMFAASKVKRPPVSLWKSILHSWMSVKPGLCKSEPTSYAEILRQLVFGNPLITNQEGKPMGLSGKSEGNALANAGHSRVGDFWDPETKEWKELPALGVSPHPSNKSNKELIIASIPWNPASANDKPRKGDWVNKKETGQTTPPEWVYLITEVANATTSALEFRKMPGTGQIQATSSHSTTIPLEGYTPVRILAQDGHGATLRLVKDIQPGKKPPILWIFESGFVADLPWDPGDWHWQSTANMSDSPFFGYTAKRGYRNARRAQHTPGIINFVPHLNLSNTSVAQVIARIWHNARPRKVGALTWSILNNGLPVGTWLQVMGIQATCQGCDQGLLESAQHCLMECPPAQQAWNAFLRVWNKWEAPDRFRITWPSVLLGETVFEGEDDPPDLHGYRSTS